MANTTSNLSGYTNSQMQIDPREPPKAVKEPPSNKPKEDKKDKDKDKKGKKGKNKSWNESDFSEKASKIATAAGGARDLIRSIFPPDEPISTR